MDNIYIDFDGVILDSEERMIERKNELGFIDTRRNNSFDDFFKYTEVHPEEWDMIIRNANEINDSVKIIRELESLKKQIVILTKIHTLYEMKVKVLELRETRKIESPIMFVPPNVDKNEIVIPNGQILVDDSKKNVEKWNKNGGKGFLFIKDLKSDDKNKVKSLKFLLRR